MNTRTYLTVAGTLGSVFGLGYLLVPVLAGGLIFKFDSPTALMFARFVGAYLLVWGLLGFPVRNSSDPQVLRGALLVSMLGHLITIALFPLAMNGGVASSYGWGNVILSAVLGFGALHHMPRSDGR